MPNKDPDKHRENSRNSMRRMRERRKAEQGEKGELVEVMREVLSTLRVMQMYMEYAFEIPEDVIAEGEELETEITQNNVVPCYSDDVIPSYSPEAENDRNNVVPVIRNNAEGDWNNNGITRNNNGITENNVIPAQLDHNSARANIGNVSSRESIGVSRRRSESNKQHDDNDDTTRARVAAIAADLPRANGAQAKKDYLFSPCPYEREIGEDTIREIAQKLAKIDQGMGGVGWVKKLFREAYHVIGQEVPRETLVVSIQSLFRALEKQKESIRSFTSWAMAAYPGMLSDVLEA